MRQFYRFLKTIFTRNRVWMFEGENKYNIQYRISFPLNNGTYRETGIINVLVPANSMKEAKQKLTRFARKKIQVTIVSFKQSQNS